MARIAIIGGAVCGGLDKELAERITQRLIQLGHLVVHGGINSGIMQACFIGGGTGIVYQSLLEKKITTPGSINTSLLKLQFPGFEEIDFGPAIRRQLLIDAPDLVIAFEGGIGTYDELVGRLKTKKKLVMIGNFNPHFLALLTSSEFSGIDVGMILKIKKGRPFELIEAEIVHFLEV
ncbi:MAG: hypothetical protein WC663_02505 [Patescibacteria group bacterium]|jgi:predicted Rossmann-fold nucleotide-binding protein